MGGRDGFKVFNDPVHGHIEIHPLCVKIIDTPQFQRLRYLKQLGACYFVYPGASHNRFEHSIGVCHLAGKLARTIQKRQSNLNITEEDILCVEIAGLCHDLGHGPFSHIFEKFIHFVKPNLNWKHEDASVTMFDHMYETNNLETEFEKHGLNDYDKTFIKEQIKKNKTKWSYKGRDKKKGFLYDRISEQHGTGGGMGSNYIKVLGSIGGIRHVPFQIVANKKNGIDVDKWEYFARDCYGLGINNNFDHKRFMKFCRVLEVEGSLQICPRDKEAETLYSLFQTRATLHRRAYQHRVCNAIGYMITDALIEADHMKIVPDEKGMLLTISGCVVKPDAYTRLNDSIFQHLLMSTETKLEESRKILKRIERRDLYRCIGETCPVKIDELKEDDSKIKEDIMSHIPKGNIDIKDKDLIVDEDDSKIKEDIMSQIPTGNIDIKDLIVDKVIIDFGKNTENPIENVRFYNKNDVTQAVFLEKHQVSLMLPEVFAETFVRLYCKKTDEKLLIEASTCFKKWCNEKGLSLRKFYKYAENGQFTENKNPPSDTT